MDPIIPPPLARGSTLGLVSPASAADPQAIDRGAAVLDAHGYRVREAPHARERLGFLAGADDGRLGDLLATWLDPQVDAVLCVRGGYGSLRLLDRLPYDRLREHAKPLIGYSDITALQWALWARSRVGSFSGPMVEGLDRAPPETLDWLWQALERGDWSQLLSDAQTSLQTWRPGRARGRLLAGNLALVCALLGTPFFPPLEGAILVLEDVGELPYRIDRSLIQLRLAGVFDRIAGLVLGDFADACSPATADPHWTLRRMVENATRGTRFPIVAGLAYGHLSRRLTLPVGARAWLATAPEARLEVARE